MRLLSICFTFILASSVVLAGVKQVNVIAKQLNVLFRHGDRTPGNFITRYPQCIDPSTGCDPSIIDKKFPPYGLGELTDGGKQRAYNLGKYLQSHYGNVFGSVYSPSKVEAVHSASNRALVSLQLTLSGMYQSSDKWNGQLQPATIAPAKPKNEDSIFVPQMCEIYTNEYNRILNSDEFKSRSAKISSFLDDLQTKIGDNHAQEMSLKDANDLYHTLVAMEASNVPLPSWAREIYPKGELRKAALLQYQLYGYNELLRKFAGGVTLRKMIDNMKKDDKKIHLYSGHELNVVMLLQTLGVYDDRFPDYSSAVILELHEIEKKQFVKVLYYYGTKTQADTLRIPGCDELCPLERFTQILQKVTPSDKDLLACKRVDCRGNVVCVPDNFD